MKSERKYIIALGICFLLLFTVQLLIPQQIDWTPTFSKHDKIPYGSYILYKLLPDLFPGQKVSTTDTPVYPYLKNHAYHNTNYIFVDSHFNTDTYASKQLLKFVSKGNNIFIASQSITGFLSDTLNIHTKGFLPTVSSVLHIGKLDSSVYKKQLKITFTNIRFHSKQTFTFLKAGAGYFSSFDTSKAIILARNSQNKPVFLKYTWGKGAIYINTIPLAFTNYNVISKNNDQFVFDALSYLPVEPTLWDEYYKADRQLISSPIKYILNQASLRWAYYLIILMVILYLITGVKRRQKIIPHWAPPKNSTMGFIQTVGQLALKKENHLKIAQKRIRYLLAFLRSRFGITSQPGEKLFQEEVMRRTGVSGYESQTLSKMIHYIQTQSSTLNDQDLLSLNKIIDNFYQKIRR